MSGDVTIVKAVPPTLKVITESPPKVVKVATGASAPKIVKVSSPGPQGPAGPPLGGIAGYSFNISGLTNGDILGFNGSAWYNRDQESITDGGNF